MKKQAVIFDMDGVITDSEPYYVQAVNVVLADQGLAMTEEDHLAIIGSSIDYTWEWVVRRFGLKEGPEHWKPRYDQAVLHLLSQNATPAPGLYLLLEQLERRNIRIGLASSSQSNWVEAVLVRLGVLARFGALATSGMVANAKPAPDLYLLAAQKLQVEPGGCIAVEDTPRGLQAARSAGMTTIAVRTESTAQMDLSAADRTIDSLEAFDLSWLE